jgi:hypothetical protein
MTLPSEGAPWADGDERWADGEERWVDGALESGADDPAPPAPAAKPPEPPEPGSGEPLDPSRVDGTSAAEQP